MNSKEYLELHQTCTKKMFEICKSKNHDYTGGGDDAFANFTGVEHASNGAVNTLQGFLTRIHDKYARICSFVKLKNLQVKDESVEDTLLDLANYCILMYGYIKSTEKPSIKPNGWKKLDAPPLPPKACPKLSVPVISGVKCPNCESASLERSPNGLCYVCPDCYYSVTPKRYKELCLPTKEEVSKVGANGIQ